MSTIREIKAAIESLRAREQRRLVRWIEERSWDDWDRQIACDVDSGRLDHVLRKVRANIRKSKLMNMP
jgi:hypothetical protein